MDTKEKFKDFVRSHPILLKHVNNGQMSWQKFYEMYDMYGEDENAWKDYLVETASSAAAAPATFDLMSFLKSIDLDSLQEGVNSVQRVLSLLGDMAPSKSTTPEVKKPRPLYKHFED